MSSKFKQPISQLQARMIEDMTARGLQAKTQTAHIRSCRRFAKWLGRSPDTATPEDVRLFQLHLAASGAGTSTRNITMTGVKFLFRTTLRRHDLVADIFYVGEPQKLPPVMSRDEVAALLDAAKALKPKAMLSLAYGCGLRAGEVCRLTVGDIDSGQGIIRIIRIIQPKGRKDRHVMLSDSLLDLLRLYWPERSKRHDTGVRHEERYLFPGRAGPITTRQFNRLFHEARQRAGITKPVNIRSLRHSFATHLLEASVDVRVIQALLGHANPLSTARYTRVATGLISKLDSPIDLLGDCPVIFQTLATLPRDRLHEWQVLRKHAVLTACLRLSAKPWSVKHGCCTTTDILRTGDSFVLIAFQGAEPWRQRSLPLSLPDLDRLSKRRTIYGDP